MKQSAIHYEKTNAIWQLADTLSAKIPFSTKNIIFCCIGTDRSTGDALGPFVGSALLEKPDFSYPIIGTVQHPLHALNLTERMDYIYETYADPFIVAIDACIGASYHVGQILIEDGPIRPGQAFQKSLPPVGQVSIKAVVSLYDANHYHFQTTRLFVTQQMSHTISEAIYLASRQPHLKLVHDRYNDRYYNNRWQ